MEALIFTGQRECLSDRCDPTFIYGKLFRNAAVTKCKVAVFFRGKERNHFFRTRHGDQPCSCTTSRLRCSSLSSKRLTATASAAALLAASTMPRTWPRFRMSDARQLRREGAALLRERDDMAAS